MVSLQTDSIIKLEYANIFKLVAKNANTFSILIASTGLPYTYIGFLLKEPMHKIMLEITIILNCRSYYNKANLQLSVGHIIKLFVGLSRTIKIVSALL